MTAAGDYWLGHFGAYLQTERILSDLFTVVALVAAVATWSVTHRRRRTISVGAAVVVLLLVVGGGYVVVGAQFRSACLRADDALAATVPIYPGAKLTASDVWPDFNNGDGPVRHHLSFTRLFPLTWNHARRLTYSLPAGITQAQLLRFYAPHFSGWRAPRAEEQLADFWWRGREAVEVGCFGSLGFDDRVADGYALVINGWSRPSRY